VGRTKGKGTNHCDDNGGAQEVDASGRRAPLSPANHPTQYLIADIKIGKRHRKDLGDIDSLARSISDIGALMHPIVVTPDGKLVAGERRLRAAESLGWPTIPVTVVDLKEIVRGEHAENRHRKDFLPTEIMSILREIEPIERAAAKERQQSGLKRGDKKPVVQILHNGGKTRDKVAAFAGISGVQLDKIKAVFDAAEQDPDRYGHLKEELDRPRGVSRAFYALCLSRDEHRILSLAPREGRFRTLVLDPPWEYDDNLHGRGAAPYGTMSREQLLALPVPNWAEDDCHLYLWATNANMPLACECMEAWGFKHKTILTWVKPKFGMGAYFRGSTEHVLFGVRGKLRLRSASIPTHFEAPTGAHSEKPDRFYDIVREASYLPAGEGFQRKPRDGFVNLYVSGAAA
jgi:N6-adenosine-specific RNA methylase IME4